MVITRSSTVRIEALEEDAITSEEDGDWKQITEINYNSSTGDIKVLYES